MVLPGLFEHDVMHCLKEGTRGRIRLNKTWLYDIAEESRIGITARVREDENRRK